MPLHPPGPLWSLHCPPRKFPCHFRRISLFPPHPQFVPTKKGNAIFGSIFPRIPAEQKKKPDFLTRLMHRVLRRRNLTSLLLHSPRLSARKLQTISVPVLLIAGTRDLIKPSHSRWLARQIPTSRLLLMTGGRHTSIFRTPAPYLRAILAFLRRS